MGNKNNKELYPPSFTVEAPDTVTGVFVSPDKRLLVIGVNNKILRLYDLESQEFKKDLEGCCFSKMTNNVINVSFSPDSTLMAFRWEEGIRVLNTTSFEVEKEIANQGTWVTSAFSPDGKMIAIGCTKDLLSIYDLSKDSSMALIKSVEGRIHQHV